MDYPMIASNRRWGKSPRSRILLLLFLMKLTCSPGGERRAGDAPVHLARQTVILPACGETPHGEHVIAHTPGPDLSSGMKQNNFSRNQNQTPSSESRAAPITNSNQNQNEVDFVPSPEEVSRRAYFSYVNQGSLSGHEVQHWLEAETQLIAERKLTRTHSRHN